MTVQSTRIVAVTGAAQGIGLGYAQHLYKNGYAVALLDFNSAKLDEVGEHFSDSDRVLRITVDVSDAKSCEAAATRVLEKFGKLDGLINNAAIFSTLQSRPFWEIPEEEWDRVFAVNVRGPWLVVKSLLPAFKASEGASIVNIGSDTALAGRPPGFMHYVSSKGAVQAMTYAMSRELGQFGIRVNTISPGFVQTEVANPRLTAEAKAALVAQQALPRMAGPDDIAEVAEFLLSDASRHVSGQTLSVNGGWIHK
jgi:NAD(P)-dependent dehydrogenase (short-subunit alcohol dehydrogenase family)